MTCYIDWLYEYNSFYRLIPVPHSGAIDRTKAAMDLHDASAGRCAAGRTARLRELALEHAPGLAAAGALAALSMMLATLPWLREHGITALTLAVILGMLAAHGPYARVAPACGPGVALSKQRLLRLGIVLYGLRLTFQDLGSVGVAGLLVDAIVLSSTFALACVVGIRFLGLDRRTAMLIGAGSSICGAAAVMATEPVVRARSTDLAIAVATVVVFGTIAMFLYPTLFPFLGLDARHFGLYAGSTVHEVAQVVAAARSVGEGAADTAVIAKMARVMMLAPFLVLLSIWNQRNGRSHEPATGPRRASGIDVPWFALGFVAVTALHSIVHIPQAALEAANTADTALLAMAMGALGLTTHVGAIRTAGARPMLLAAILFGWLIGGGLAINLAVGAALSH